MKNLSSTIDFFNNKNGERKYSISILNRDISEDIKGLTIEYLENIAKLSKTRDVKEITLKLYIKEKY